MQPDLKATGSVSIVMVLSLRRFIQEEAPASSAQRYLPAMIVRWLSPPHSPMARFDQVRGSGAYADFLKHLRPSKWFEIDTQEARIETHGHELSTFRQYLITNYFFPTYRLTKNELILTPALIQEHPALMQELESWVFKVRFTRNGLVVVKLERKLDAIAFPDISRRILEIQRGLPALSADQDELIPTQWRLAMDVVARFVEACGEQFTIATQVDQRQVPITIHLTRQYSEQTLPLHDRHIVYLFSRITAADQVITVQELKERYPHEIVGLLENAMLIDQELFQYPRYKASQIAAIFQSDTASWEDEICLITSEASILYCPMSERVTAFMSGSTRTESTQVYTDYWKTIARGIEHVVALRNEVQLLERDTTRLLETIPDITRKAADGHLSGSDQRDILHLATGIAGLFKSLPQQRDALVPSSMFRAGYATLKFKRLMELLGIYEVERHIETNVQELNAFLAHFHSIQLQQDEQRTNLIFSILTVVFSVLIVPSFLADLKAIEWLTQNDLDAVPSALRWLFKLGGIGSGMVLLWLLGALVLFWLGRLVFVWLSRTSRRS